jgi:hypothetical protein
MRIVLLMLTAALAACHGLDHYVVPYGQNTYRCDDAECPKFANKYCAARGKVVQPVQANDRRNDDAMIFQCVDSSAQHSPEVAALPSKH